MTLLTICQDAARELALNIPAGIVGLSDDSAIVLFRLAKEEARSLARRHHWQALVAEHAFFTSAADEQALSIPAAFDRLIPETMFNRTSKRLVFGPIDASEWQAYKSTTTARVNPAFRIRGGTILIAPQPTAGQTVAYEYVSKNLCLSSVGTAQLTWQADTDTGRIDEYLMTLGVIWRYKAAKGFAHEPDRLEYERGVVDAIINDGGRPRIRTDAVAGSRPVAPSAPDTIVF